MSVQTTMPVHHGAYVDALIRESIRQTHSMRDFDLSRAVASLSAEDAIVCLFHSGDFEDRSTLKYAFQATQQDFHLFSSSGEGLYKLSRNLADVDSWWIGLKPRDSTYVPCNASTS